MWLLNVDTFELEYFPAVPRHEYAISSHTWEDGEVLFVDMAQKERAKNKTGWHKIENTCRLARAYGARYAWIDTCCIDKSSSAELTEAINSMFRYYRDSKVCLAYLSDCKVPVGADRRSLDFRSLLAPCRWFTRGWALQELIAPQSVLFFDGDWCSLRQKHELVTELSSVTGITSAVLRMHDYSVDPIDAVPVWERMSWAASRTTTREEDIAYCLLGIFDVHMPILYGEGTENASSDSRNK
ncbi:heterokaryon incompatibility protein-domain-containing protein [Coniochaeta sp. 2T2.1]|nr:heterokaryon incompatibility protein-domain-containing protein [Coniochaeta sp. 2T2.1]